MQTEELHPMYGARSCPLYGWRLYTFTYVSPRDRAVCASIYLAHSLAVLYFVNKQNSTSGKHPYTS